MVCMVVVLCVSEGKGNVRCVVCVCVFLMGMGTRGVCCVVCSVHGGYVVCF